MRQLPNLLLPAKKFKRLYLLFCLIFASGISQAQNYEVINHRIDSLVNLGLPKSALAEVSKLEQLARKNKNAPQQIQSVLYRMTLQSYLEENALVAIIDSLKSDINHAAYPVKPVLQSLLGSMYYNYYQQNRWQFNQRSKLLKPSSDYTQWDLQTLIDETSRLYLQSLKDAKQEQATPISVLDGVLQGDLGTRYLRPSLYDLLVQRALDFFLSDEPSLTKPQMPFTLNDQRFFGDNDAFADLKVKTTDTASTYYYGIKLLQQASLFHLQKHQDEALADLSLKRLEFMFSKSTFSNKDSLYTNALKGIANEYATKPISVDAWVDLGKYYQQKDSLVTAMFYFNKAVNAYPESLGGHNASTLIKQVRRRELSAMIENVNMPGKPILALINYRNVKTIKYSVYHLSQQQYKDYRDSWSLLGNRYNAKFDRNKPTLEAWVKAYIRNNKSVQQQQLQLPDPHDYRLHRTEFGVDKLQPGAYLLYIEDAQSGDTVLNNYTDFQVSRLAYSARIDPDNSMEIKAIDRQTGEPLKGVTVKVKSHNYNELNDRVDTGITDKSGGMISWSTQHYNTSFEVTYKGDTLTTPSTYVDGQTYGNEDEPKNKTILFTDRQIYRPGQTIYFKGLQLQMVGQKSSIRTDWAADVEFKDQNNKTLNTLKLKSNEFGTFNGSFVIPQTILNGQVSLQTNDGDIYIRVEEYKRPTFKAEFLPVTESYKLNDSVKVKGNVIAFSGYGLLRARVAYHVMRSPVYSRYSRSGYNSKEVKADTIYTDEQGNFTVNFKAEASPGDDNRIVYNYNITADITDASGETHSANTYVKVGNNNISIVSYLNTSIFAADTNGVTTSINNLNGQRIKGKLQVQVYALQNPPHLFKTRLWFQKPDLFLMNSTEYKSKFPYYAFANEDDATTWQQLAKLSDSTYTVDDKRIFRFHLNGLNKQPSGLYKVIMMARNQQGDTTSTTRYFTLVANPAKPSAMTHWVTAVNNTVNPGTKVEYMVGIDEPVNVLVEKYSRTKKVSSQWMHIEKGQKRIAIPISLTDSTVNIQFMMVFQNRMYSSYQKVNIVKPDKSLDIKMLTFRDKLQPGDKEQWKLQVTAPGNEKQAAEMVAGMYDASLDDVSNPTDWRNALNQNQYYPNSYFNWNSYNFVQQINSQQLIRRNYVYQTQTRQYETLNLFGYNYYGGYNAPYQNYLRGIQSRSTMLQRDRELQQSYERNAALVKNGVDVTGRVVDENGTGLPGVSVSIRGVKISTSTNSNGEFKIRILPNGVLLFNFIGYGQQELMIAKAGSVTVKLKAMNSSLNEVVVVGYGTEMRRSVTGAVSSVVLRKDTVVYSANAYKVNGKDYYGYLNGTPGANLQIQIRGSSSLSSDKAPLYVIDGVIMDGSVSGISPADVLSIDVLKDAGATAIYGARGANGVVIITTKTGKAKLMGSQPITIRKNFNETAFFYPQLRTNEKGEILIDFTIPEALTKWKFRAFAHTQDLKTGYIEREIVTQKQLSISANTPRFLREGDTVTISARLANLSTGPLTGKVNLQLFNGITMQPVKLLVDEAGVQQSFEIAASTNKAVSFKLAIPAGLDALTYRLTADAGQFSDGEENTIPVLPNRMLVIESMPMMVRSGQTKAFTLGKLINQKSNTLKSKTLTMEYTQNPAWYAVQALPYMMEFPYECSEQIFNRYYANTLGTSLVNKMPVIKKVFDQWKVTNSAELTSNLEKNPELKATLLEETPWLRDAISETEQKKRIALLFDFNKMSNELQLNLDKLQKRQLLDGGFPWFGGDRSDEYITRDILAGIGQLYHLGIVDLQNQTLKTIADKSIAYLDAKLIEAALIAKARKNYERRDIRATEVHSYYVESYFTARTTGQDLKPFLANYLNLAAYQWKELGIYEQALIALTMQRYNRPEVAKAIVRSLNETAQKSDDLGMYWAKNQLGFYWYQSPIETQSLMIELFTEVGGYEKEVEEMKIWLLRNKQTTNWKTTKATAAACYALLLKGNDWLADNGTSTIKLGGKELSELKPDIKADAGTGYIKTNWVDDAIKPALGNVSITNNGKTMSWGALHWQYLENLDKITPSNTDIHLERKYFIAKQTASGEVLTALDASHQPKTGDLLKVVVYLKSGREFEYVQLKDMRPAGTEPVDALSTYKYQDGLFYYQVTKDVATNFFISYLNKGNYVFEYRLRVVQPGNFSTGISTVQCMYAPEFNAHSEGSRMVIK